MKDKTVINTAANFVSKAWAIISSYIFIPIYIKYLGEEAYGLVSFFATLYSVMQLLGVGLSSTLRREFASGDESKENKNRKYKLLRSVENIYFVIAIIIFFIVFLGRKYIANEWLNFNTLTPSTIETVLAFMGLAVGFQLIGNLYFGSIMGSGNQVVANSFNILWSILKSVGSIVVCIATKNVVIFYLWHIISDIVFILCERIFLRRYLGKQDSKWTVADFRNLKTIWRYTLGLFAISIVAVINKQLDKTVISGLLSLSELGAYNLATTLGSLTLIIPNAVSAAVFATFTREYTNGVTNELNKHYRMYSKFVAIIAACMGAFIAVFSYEIIIFWTSNYAYADMIKEAAPFVIIANMLIGLQEVPYALVLSRGNTKINNILGIVSLPIICVTTYYAVKYYGLVGAGVAYLIQMFIQTIIYVFVVTKKYTDTNPGLFILSNELLPLTICLAIAFLTRKGIYALSTNNTLIVLFAVLSGVITLIALLNVYLGKDIKHVIKSVSRGKRA